MRITFERSGGFAGVIIKRDFDLDDLADDVKDALENLLDTADFFDLPAQLPSKGVMPDSFSYVISVRSNKGEHTVRFGEGEITDDLRPLVDRLWQMATKR